MTLKASMFAATPPKVEVKEIGLTSGGNSHSLTIGTFPSEFVLFIDHLNDLETVAQEVLTQCQALRQDRLGWEREAQQEQPDEAARLVAAD